MKQYPQVFFPGAVVALVLFEGCTVGPITQKPKTAAPAQWSAPMAGGETNLAPSIAGWWKSFNDPQLDSLIERAVNANHNLRIAGAVRSPKPGRSTALPPRNSGPRWTLAVGTTSRPEQASTACQLSWFAEKRAL